MLQNYATYHKPGWLGRYMINLDGIDISLNSAQRSNCLIEFAFEHIQSLIY